MVKNNKAFLLTSLIISMGSLSALSSDTVRDEQFYSMSPLEAAPALIPMCELQETVTLSGPKHSCTYSDYLTYPSCHPMNPTLPKDKPRLGLNADNSSEQCSFMSSLVSGDFLDEAMKPIENHDPRCTGNACQAVCDKDCDNLFISELYESYLIKFSLESAALTNEILRIYRKIFDKFDRQQLLSAYEHWLHEPPLFPVNQKERDWSQYRKDVALKNIIGISHDPTNVLLGGDFLKQLQYELPDDFKAKRDYMFNSVLKKARGYRTNSKKGREGLTEAQIGITSFDLADLKLKPEYYETTKWMHPGRSQCDTAPLQGMYQNEAFKKFIPLKCGISGSTNFWIWTALYSGVNLTPEEMRLFVLSAYIVLGADGGHSLMEVLSSATMSAIYMKHYATYSDDLTLTPYIRNSNFARNLYEITKDINPIGNGEMQCIDFDEIAQQVYLGIRYQPFNDTKNPNKTEISHRKQIEAFFLRENSRFAKPFGDYGAFLDKIPQLDKVRRKVAKKLKQYVHDYCGEK